MNPYDERTYTYYLYLENPDKPGYMFVDKVVTDEEIDTYDIFQIKIDDPIDGNTIKLDAYVFAAPNKCGDYYSTKERKQTLFLKELKYKKLNDYIYVSERN